MDKPEAVPEPDPPGSGPAPAGGQRPDGHRHLLRRRFFRTDAVLPDFSPGYRVVAAGVPKSMQVMEAEMKKAPRAGAVWCCPANRRGPRCAAAGHDGCGVRPCFVSRCSTRSECCSTVRFNDRRMSAGGRRKNASSKYTSMSAEVTAARAFPSSRSK